MPEEFENAVANKNSEIHEIVKKTPHLEAKLLDSMAQPIILLSQRFTAMKIKEDCVKLNEPARNEKILAKFEKIHVFDPDISANRLRKENLKHSMALYEEALPTKSLCVPGEKVLWPRLLLLQGAPNSSCT